MLLWHRHASSAILLTCHIPLGALHVHFQEHQQSCEEEYDQRENGDPVALGELQRETEEERAQLCRSTRLLLRDWLSIGDDDN
jgi:hypothetical protein